MSELTNAADAIADGEEPKAPTMEEAQALAESGEAEGTTPEEVAAVLKNSGIKIPAEPAPAAADDEEGDDVDDDAAAGADAGADDDEGADDEGADADDTAAADAKAASDKAAADAAAAGTGDDKYSFTVEDANGVTFKITAGDNLEEVLSEFEAKSNGQGLAILKQLGELEAQKAADDKTAQEETAKAEQTQRVADIRKGWDSEVTDLTAQKRIPAGTDGEKRVGEVYKYMAEENDRRMAAGKPTIGSFEDALDKLESIEARDKAAADAKAAKDTARKNGALVGGSSAAATTGAKPYRAGSARNANEAIRSMGLL